MTNSDYEYEYDVFISLAHNSSTLKWIEKWFMPIFHPALAHDLGKSEDDVKIYLAKHEIDGGSYWDSTLVEAVAQSRTMVALLCHTYRNKEWCQIEYSLMLARQQLDDVVDRSRSLVVPVFIHDWDEIEVRKILGKITPIDLVRPVCLFANYISEDSEDARLLEIEIKKISECVAKAIGNSPNYTPNFKSLECDEYIDKFRDAARYNNKPIVPGRVR